MDHKVDPRLEAEIKARFPAMKNRGTVIEIVDGAIFSVKTFDDGEEICKCSWQNALAGKTYFLIDHFDDKAIFFYHAKLITLVKDYFTDQVLHFQRRPEIVNDKGSILEELEKLESILKAKIA